MGEEEYYYQVLKERNEKDVELDEESRAKQEEIYADQCPYIPRAPYIPKNLKHTLDGEDKNDNKDKENKDENINENNKNDGNIKDKNKIVENENRSNNDNDNNTVKTIDSSNVIEESKTKKIKLKEKNYFNIIILILKILIIIS